jgi:hypothetical protein
MTHEHVAIAATEVVPKRGAEMRMSHIVADILTRGLRQFSNRHEGETCYIFGDGPSIKWFDLKAFNDHPAICCGLLPFHKDFGELNAKYVTMVEPWMFVPQCFQPKMLHGMQHIGAEYKKRVSSMPGKEIFVSLSNRLSLRGKNIHYVYRKLPRCINQTDKLLNQFDCFSGSFYATLALAYYLGFRTIFLVGFDGWTIQPARALHWYELGEGEFFEPTNFATEFLNVLKRDMDIYTISCDGKSQNVTSISYEAHTGNIPTFRENCELLSRNDLDVLATYSGYKIYSKA